MSLDDIRLYCGGIVVVSAVLFIVLERLYPYDKRQRLFREQFWNDFGLYTILQSYILGLLISYVIEYIDTQTGLSRYQIVTDWSIPVQLLFFIVLHDHYMYWFHRIQHNSKYLWRIHEAHHSTNDVDWLSGSRSHSIEIFINQTIEFSVMVIMGAAPVVLILKATIDGIWGMYIHSNINIRSGKLQYIINGPEMHRWHHAADEDAHNTNYATKLAIWDHLFGTAFYPKERKPIGYGLEEAGFPKSYVQQHIYAFRPFEE